MILKYKWYNQCRQVKLRRTMTNGPYTNTHLEQHDTCRTTRRNRLSEQTICVGRFHLYFIFLMSFLRHIQVRPKDKYM